MSDSQNETTTPFKLSADELMRASRLVEHVRHGDPGDIPECRRRLVQILGHQDMTRRVIRFGNPARGGQLPVGVVEHDLALAEQALDQIAVAQLVVGDALHHVGMGSVIGAVEHRGSSG